MIIRQVAILCFLTLFFNLNAQNDSVKCEFNCVLKEGVYLNYYDFRNQNPVLKEEIESALDKNQVNFIGKILKENKFTYNKGGEKIISESKNVWGFYQNNSLHVNFADEFNRVSMFGSISYLIATIEVTSPGMYTPGYGGMMGGSITTKEVRSFFMNFYDGKIIPFSQGEAEELISRDKELYKEFKTLKARQRKDQISRYIRKYNEINPVYFLK